MESGRLNTVATIYSRNLLVDQYGSKMITYKKVTTTRCELKHAESKKAAIPNSNGAAENVVVYNNEVQ